jgi:hypothetical protein
MGALDGGGVRETGSSASCDLAIFGTARMRNDADEVGGTQGRAAWRGQLALHARRLVRARPRTGAWLRPDAASA